MARMLPPLSDGFVFRSRAERDVYAWLSSETPDEWVVLHSVWLRRSQQKEHAEIDFLVLTDTACLCLEVKGHKVWRDGEGSWHFETLDGSKSEIRNEGPFDQAREAYYSARRTLEAFDQKHLFFNRVWGYGVITPDCALDVRKGDGWVAPEMLIDSRRYPNDAVAAIDELVDYWETDKKEHKRNLGRSETELKPLSEADRNEIMQIFRREISVLEGYGVSAQNSLREANALTEQQFLGLDFLSANPRILMHGLAGTGKTMLAVEQARRASVKGEVLFVCFNKNLAEKLAANARDSEQRGVTYLNYHQLVISLAKQSGLEPDIAEDWQEFNAKAADLVLASLERLGDRFKPYHYLVVDEAQDLMSADFFSALDLLLTDGLDAGSWLVSLDPGQTLYRQQFDPAMLERLELRSARFDLAINCRNTKQIASYVSGISQISANEVRSVDGPHVEFNYFDNYVEYEKLLRGYLNKIVADYRESGTQLEEVTLLVSDKRFAEDLSPATKSKLLVPIKPYSAQRDSQAVAWSSIHGFKGLESTAAIVVFNGDLNSEEQRILFYVAGSRARVSLIILVPASAEKAIDKARPLIGKLLSSALD
jgi:hypothetical protein